MFHFHKYKIVIRERINMVRKIFGMESIPFAGLRTLEVCNKCGAIRAWLTDSNGDSQEKLPESIFTDEELEKARI